MFKRSIFFPYDDSDSRIHSGPCTHIIEFTNMKPITVKHKAAAEGRGDSLVMSLTSQRPRRPAFARASVSFDEAELLGLRASSGGGVSSRKRSFMMLRTLVSR